MRKQLKIIVSPLRVLNAAVLAFSPLMVSVMLALTLYTFLFDNNLGLIIGVIVVKAGLVFGVMLAVDYLRKYKRANSSEADEEPDEYDFYSNVDYWDKMNKGK